MKDFWNVRYSEEGYAYGISPNDFLQENIKYISPNAEILCIAEGEGRNAIYLAQKGFHVTAVDQSEVGIRKTLNRAKEENLIINAIVADLDEYSLGLNKWDVIVSIFGHLPPLLRKKVHHEIPKALKKNGIFLCEAYTTEQLKFGTGGPKDPEMFLSQKIIKEELSELEIIQLQEIERIIHEGKYHQGMSAVVQFIGKKNT